MPRVDPPPREPAFFSHTVIRASRFFKPLGGAGRLRVVGGGLEECGRDYAVDRRTVPYTILEFVVSGAGRVELDGHASALRPGSLFAYGRTTRNRISVEPGGGPLAKYFITFDGGSAEGALADVGLPVGSAAATAEPGRVLPLFEEILRNGRRGGDAAPAVCAALADALLLVIGDTLATGSPRCDAFETYGRLCREIDAEAATLRTLADLAARCGVSRAYACRVFQRFGRETPGQRLRRARLELAARRLLSPRATVKGVAAELGFADAFHFSRTFKAVHGFSPSDVVRSRSARSG